MGLDDLLGESGLAADSPVVLTVDQSWTRAEVEQEADAIAASLRDSGVEAGHPVAVALPDGPLVVAAIFGVWRAGGVYVPVHPRLTATEVDRVLALVRPAVVLAAAEDGWAVRPVPDPVRHARDVALIQFTSGTTGAPKPVLLRHSGVLELLDGVIRTLRGGGKPGAADRPPQPNLVPVSLSLWAGIYQVLFALRVGAPVVVMAGFDTGVFAGLVRRFRIRSTVLPPAAMTMLADDETISDLEPLRYVRSISAPLSPFQARRFRDRFGIAVLNCYGQTEIGGEIIGWSAADSREFGETKLGAVGRPHDGVAVRVVDGELCVRTPAMSAGYATGDDLADRLTDDGWFRTGDIGRIDDDGFVWIEGRLSDMINRGGLKVFPEEVAEVVRVSPAVTDAAVVGMPDDRLGEVPWAFVVPAIAGAGVDVAELEALCRRHLAPYKVPVRFEVIAELPRNDVGKVVARDLVSLVGSRRPTGTTASPRR